MRTSKTRRSLTRSSWATRSLAARTSRGIGNGVSLGRRGEAQGVVQLTEAVLALPQQVLELLLVGDALRPELLANVRDQGAAGLRRRGPRGAEEAAVEGEDVRAEQERAQAGAGGACHSSDRSGVEEPDDEREAEDDQDRRPGRDRPLVHEPGEGRRDQDQRGDHRVRAQVPALDLFPAREGGLRLRPLRILDVLRGGRDERKS